MTGPLISLIVPTFERPRSLHLVLLSLARQAGLSRGDMEIIVADDGSRDHTAEVVRYFRKSSRWTVRFTTHPHDGFQLARTRNDGVRASSAPYLLFLDGDCVAPANHVLRHLRHRRRRAAVAGFCYYLAPETSARFDESAVVSGAFERWATPQQRKQLMRMDWKARAYCLLRHPRRPKLYGGNFGIWRDDFERINGFNEEFTGWGCEDDEFRVRLRRSGVRVRAAFCSTCTYHLWHPPAKSYPRRWQDGANVEKLNRETRRTSVRCEHGLHAPAAKPAA